MATLTTMNDFQLWEAERFDGRLLVGSTRPFVAACSSPAQLSDIAKRVDVVVKVASRFSFPDYLLPIEVVGNWIAARCGVSTPAPGIVNLSADFVRAAAPQLSALGVELKPGVAAGCRYLSPGFVTIGSGHRLSENQRAEAAAIYAVDLLLQNHDRTPENPNCGLHRGHLIAYDFADGCWFLRSTPLFRPWEVSMWPDAHDHLFRRQLQRKRPDWRPIAERIGGLNEGDFRQLKVQLPAHWQQELDRIAEHVLVVAAHSEYFARELTRSLK